MASFNCRILSCRSICSVRMTGVVVDEFPFTSHPTMDRVSLAQAALFTVLSAQQTLVTRRFSWVDGCAAYHCVRHCRWVVTLLCCGYPGYVFHARPHTRNCLLPSHSFPLIFLCAHHPGVITMCGASSITPCDFSLMIEISLGLTKSSSFVAPLSAGYCRASVVMCRSDLIIML